MTGARHFAKRRERDRDAQIKAMRVPPCPPSYPMAPSCGTCAECGAPTTEGNVCPECAAELGGES
jgi:hypothetical protein